MKGLLQYLKTSTLKREASSLLMLWLLTMATRAFWNADVATQITILGMFIPFAFAAFAGAFTMDWVSKQTTMGGPPTNDIAVNQDKVAS
jgi:hypothetical protein